MLDTAIGIAYSFLSGFQIPAASITIMLLYAVAIAILRPYLRWSSFVIGFGEALILAIVNIVGVAHQGGSKVSPSGMSFLILIRNRYVKHQNG